MARLGFYISRIYGGRQSDWGERELDQGRMPETSQVYCSNVTIVLTYLLCQIHKERVLLIIN